MLLVIELLLHNAPALGAGDREFKSLYPDTEKYHMSLSKSLVSRRGSFILDLCRTFVSRLSFIINCNQIYPFGGH